MVCIPSAKVPIVKIWDPELKLACDMNVNNTLALENTRMVRTYVEIDERVRPLAMIIKYWTRRRVVNDAGKSGSTTRPSQPRQALTPRPFSTAFGSTLSSYTWICLIIAFLQLREPPVLPALHQCPHLKLPTTDGHETEFADDLSKLRGFGDKNGSTIGELLFQFFKFYAHEFDYDNMALSVRLGKMIPKTEKKWHVAMNNMLCVEEPFNSERNLGNTADDFSFRGLHLELRRAFDLIADAKLDECCEQFVFPKEEVSEAKPFVKQAPRPAIIRSSSQQHTGRGGRNGGGRGGRNQFRNGNSSRRASSSNAYENVQNPAAPAATLPQAIQNPAGMTAGDMPWPQMTPHYAYADMAVLSNALSFGPHDAARWQWYVQQQQHQFQQHVMAQAQRMQVGSTQTTERSRTNSFDHGAPLTAPPRPEYYVWPAHLQQGLYIPQPHPHTGFGTHPSSPSASTATPEFRRSLHRSNAANESGSPNSAGTLRSQSQPASRTFAPTNQNGQGHGATSPAANGLAGFAPHQPNLSPFPAYVSDDRTDSEVGEGSSRTLPDSPEEDKYSNGSNGSPGYLGYFVANSSVSPPRLVNGQNAVGDVRLTSASRRRLSTEGPQSVLDRRLQRTSRSPSPLGHGRAISNGNNPIVANGSAPLVVNGSTYVPTPTAVSSWMPPTPAEHAGFDNPLHISQRQEGSSSSLGHESLPMRPQVANDPKSSGPDRPLVVNGSTQSPVFSPTTTGPMSSLGPRVTASHAMGVPPYPAVSNDGFQGKGKGSDMKWQRLPSRQQQAGIAPLDLAVANPMFSDAQHLSPVYEHRTPSPTVFRAVQAAEPLESSRPPQRNGTTKGGNDGNPTHSSRANGQTSRDTGSRPSKGEGESGGGWKAAKPRKNKADNKGAGKQAYNTQSEQPPKNESERKGG